MRSWSAVRLLRPSRLASYAGVHGERLRQYIRLWPSWGMEGDGACGGELLVPWVRTRAFPDRVVERRSRSRTSASSFAFKSDNAIDMGVAPRPGQGRRSAVMTRQPTSEEIHPHGHLISRGSALHRHHRTNPIGHDVDVMVGQATRGQEYDLVHQHHGKASSRP